MYEKMAEIQAGENWVRRRLDARFFGKFFDGFLWGSGGRCTRGRATPEKRVTRPKCSIFEKFSSIGTHSTSRKPVVTRKLRVNYFRISAALSSKLWWEGLGG